MTDAPETTPEVTPEDFDLAAWLTGIAPARAEYPLDGKRIPMTARTPSWVQQFVEDHKDVDSDVQDRAYLAAHMGVEPDALKALQAGRPADFAEMINLAAQLDTKPSNQIAPRFLPAASD